jgi:hypothetical protein
LVTYTNRKILVQYLKRARYRSENNFILSHQNNYVERPSMIMLLQTVLTF